MSLPYVSFVISIFGSAPGTAALVAPTFAATRRGAVAVWIWLLTQNVRAPRAIAGSDVSDGSRPGTELS